MSLLASNRLRFCLAAALLVLIALPLTVTLLHSGLGSDDEVRLVHKLFLEDGYNPLIRPVRNLTDTVTVKFGMAMIQLINVDEKNQIMKSNVWLRMLWTDYQLKWDPSDFGGITVIRILPEKVWKPDIVLFNNADGKYEVSYKPNVVIYHTGDVLWIPPAIYKSSCTIDVKYFPFDQQECEMKFGSWTFNGDQVVLDWYEGQERVDLSDYVNSGTWDIIACPGEYRYTLDEVEHHHKAQITFLLRIRRKTLFYTVNLIIPCVLISFLSVCVFYLPADAGEKMTMCISILLALVVFLLLVSKILPPTSITIPLIAKYLLFTFIMNIVTILITVIIINWNFKTPRTHRMPRWVRLVFLNHLPRLLLMKRPHHDDRWAKKAYSRRHRGTRSSTSDPNSTLDSFTSGARSDLVELYDVARRTSTSVSALDRKRCHDAAMRGGGPVLSSSSSPATEAMPRTVPLERRRTHVVPPAPAPPDGPRTAFPMTQETQRAIEAVSFIASHLKNEDDYAEILEDWRYTAMVIDRLQLYIFLAVTVGGTVGILIHAPHIFEYVDQDEIKRNIGGNFDLGL